MYFWDINKLEKDLKKWLSEKENMKYLLAIMIIFTLSMFQFVIKPNIYDYLIALFFLFFTIFELIYLFKINKSDKGVNFLSRYLSIWFVILVRSIAFLLLPLLVLLVIWISVFYWENIPEHTTLFDLLFMVFYSLGYLFLEIKSFKKINS